MDAKDFLRAVTPVPEWLQQAWADAEQRGLDKLTPEEIEAEIADYRRNKNNAS